MPFSTARPCFLLLAILALPARGFLFDDLPVFFPLLRCGVAFLRSDFAILNFDKYDDFFRDDSVFELAQTGIYQGAADIEEYIRFIDPASSPYVARLDRENKVNERKFLQYNSDTGQCEFLVIERNVVLLDPTNTNYLPEFHGIVMVKVYFDLKERYFTRMSAYYPEDFLRVFFGVALNSENTRRHVCSEVIEGSCSDIVSATDDCEASLQALPFAEGPLNHIDDDSQGCRALHAAFAGKNPEQHCAHLSFSRLQDPRGRFKCQSSKLRLRRLPSDLFTESDFAAHRKFAIKMGIDPEIGHDSEA